jgi:hypothetical protein
MQPLSKQTKSASLHSRTGQYKAVPHTTSKLWWFHQRIDAQQYCTAAVHSSTTGSASQQNQALSAQQYSNTRGCQPCCNLSDPWLTHTVHKLPAQRFGTLCFLLFTMPTAPATQQTTS